MVMVTTIVNDLQVKTLTGPREVVKVSAALTTFLWRLGLMEHTNSFKLGAYKSSGSWSSLVIRLTPVKVGCEYAHVLHSTDQAGRKAGRQHFNHV